MVALTNEKSVLPSMASLPAEHNETSQPKQSWSYKNRKALIIAFGLFALLRCLAFPIPGLSAMTGAGAEDATPSSHVSSCAQGGPIFPKAFDVSSVVHGEKDQIISWLSGAVKVPTEIFDVMGEIGVDERWDVFYKFAEYLEEAYPLIHKHLTRTRVQTHALIFEWQGSDPSLKPLLLTGHQDVVPVLPATRDQWTHDPYGGEYDGHSIWGRGSIDDKSGVIGFLSAIELLLKSGKFEPTRTVILALGTDEETGGKVGALHLGQWIEEKYGKDSIAMLVDEGNGVSEVWGQLFAAPAVGEKGYLDLELSVETLGGHSSVPPPHTGIGYISLLIAALEKNPHKPYLNAESPLVAFTSCGADTVKGFPKDLAKAVRKVESSLQSKSGKVDKKALKVVEDWWVTGSEEDETFIPGMGKAMVSTTQAVDIINGALKVNALPESVVAVVNHRINIASSVAELQKHLLDVIVPVASELNLAVEAFGKEVEYQSCHSTHHKGPKLGKVILAEAFNSSLDPAPVSPFTIADPSWKILSGSVQNVFTTRPGFNATEADAKKTITMAPSISTGNTDTKRYWNLTKNIYRFAYLTGGKKDNVGAHTVNEHVSADSFVELVRWFANLIVIVDETREL
ncbi:hypothetical protein CI109_103699 [Kwoniella shandongensis]|uniref:Uncharacterized protein n=1 Tax=Kwoniella shandongensis TaxID=1734106 RepID=A0A5M6CB76_9TREE|nr:uncharacterized protein CI109_000604 [Kwoniella shandongensis]KAA5531032.1 hypothetical protein CI109_000604 [Kwoniella shandongensis]